MAQDPAPFLIALDWGTTSLRAYLLDREGRVLDRSATRKGVMQIGRGEFAAEFDRIVGPWRAADPRLLIGDELRCALKHGGPPDALVGEATLCGRYAAALARFGIADMPVIDNAAPAGLFRIAAAGLPDRTETVEP